MANDQVLLGLPDGPIDKTDDTDAYITKLGGLPVWLQDEQPPKHSMCKCKVCGAWMYLLCQSYVPLPDSIFHRVLYIWGCNRRQCMGKEGSFSVIRSHLVDEQYLKERQKKEAQKKKKNKKQQAKAAATALPQGFQMGDVWGANTGFGSSTDGFGSAAGFGSTTGGFGSTNASAAGFGSTTSNFGSTAFVKDTPPPAKPDALADQLGQLSLDTRQSKQPVVATVDKTKLPSFPGEYLYIGTEDTTDKQESADMTKYKEYIDMAEQYLDDDDDEQGGGMWGGETYEKQALPRGVDKQFKKFMERVAYEPSQCIRYEWSGTPLLYHAPTTSLQPPACSSCGQPRVFEMQLMPNLLSVLPTADTAAASSPSASTSSTSQPSSKQQQLDAMNQGMEFGTVLVFVCKADCHPGDDQDPTHATEFVIVQYEQ
ncbi:hypothetical protein DM01DRAFT_1410709 [Hesseltinella vesiculosa]|uniref:Programmed cell death protein 2 C-terminal domain-containing protein n=1 Tax=Hesseltinella vesiculosa TaxID=101127 RepID=A0A1X2G627_9FUNG|nr:hypothetical protein DM01DRAFT_1410709 [Hesseltinella vesiculosa]